ncbi:hypothetical protein Mapa_006499 [Marchantia paleacea]|nr:hypothetical protein Mapa_006499 [Marchantia paleacea]
MRSHLDFQLITTHSSLLSPFPLASRYSGLIFTNFRRFFSKTGNYSSDPTNDVTIIH